MKPRKRTKPYDPTPENLIRAYNRSLRFLSYRPRSTKEVEEYLLKKGYHEETIKTVIKELYDLKFLNDPEFADWWTQQRQTVRPKSKYIIRRELKQKGIDQELTDKTLENAQEDFQVAKELYERKKRQFEKYEGDARRQKVAQFLGRRGFNWDIIKKVLELREDD